MDPETVQFVKEIIENEGFAALKNHFDSQCNHLVTYDGLEYYQTSCESLKAALGNPLGEFLDVDNLNGPEYTIDHYYYYYEEGTYEFYRGYEYLGSCEVLHLSEEDMQLLEDIKAFETPEQLEAKKALL